MNDTALLLSIKPRYADSIFNGSKTVELRRVRPQIGAGGLVMVYVSSPRCSLEGAFEVAEVTAAAPAMLWRLVGKNAGVTREEFDDYFIGRDIGYGISIRRAWKLSPVSLARLRASKLRPPQSYYYVRRSHPAFAKAHQWVEKGRSQCRDILLKRAMDNLTSERCGRTSLPDEKRGRSPLDRTRPASRNEYRAKGSVDQRKSRPKAADCSDKSGFPEAVPAFAGRIHCRVPEDYVVGERDGQDLPGLA
jgi:predicted transcriptional regulator